MDSSSDSDDLWNLIRDANDHIDDSKRDESRAKVYNSFKQMEKEKLTKVDGYILKGLLTKKFWEDDIESSMTSEGFTDIDKAKKNKEQDLSSASLIHADEERPM